MAGTFQPIKRFLHWGPLTAIGIIKSITFMTLYMNSMWWPPNLSLGGFINQTVFLMLSSLTAFNFVMAALTGPRFLPLGWYPKEKETEAYLQFCTVCQGYKAPRSHHCRKCDRCVIKMDHHCPWINNCVGWANHAYFTCFLGFAVIGCTQATIILSASLYRGIHRQWYLYYGKSSLATVHLGMWSLVLCIFCLGLAIGVVIAVGMLLSFQIRAIVRNRTAIEDWILEKAKYRREGTAEKFIYPYNLGLKRNIMQVANWSCEPIGDGYSWTITESCDQFTLTREQIAQKAEKRARTRTYTIIKKVTGSWVPLWSQGFKVCINPPCTDEPRIKLQIGDVVKVTRWRKHWLFGERTLVNGMKLNGSGDGNSDQHNSEIANRTKGWFPRQCAIELIENDSDDNYQQQFSNDNKKKK